MRGALCRELAWVSGHLERVSMGMMQSPPHKCQRRWGKWLWPLAEAGLNPLLSFEQGWGREGEEKKKRT